MDVSEAYQQLLLDEESVEFITISTHQWLFQHTRLPFGVASALACSRSAWIFCCRTSRRYFAIWMTSSYWVLKMRSILVIWPRSWTLEWLHMHGFRLKETKCEFLKSLVEYSGHTIDAEGLNATPSRWILLCKLQHRRMSSNSTHLLA